MSSILKSFEPAVGVRTETDPPRPSGFEPSAIYSEPWVRKNFWENGSHDSPKYDRSIVVKRSWCTANPEGSTGEPGSSKQPSSSSFLRSLDQRPSLDNGNRRSDDRSIGTITPLLSSLSSNGRRNRDFIYVDSFARQLNDANGTFTCDSYSNDNEPIFLDTKLPNSSLSDGLDHSRDKCAQPSTSKEHSKSNTFFQRFIWTENIEHRSPWVRHRSKEIFEHVNGLFEKQKPEPSENYSETIFSDSKTTEVDHSEIDEGITYELANKLCDTLFEKEKNSNKVSSESQCLPNEDLKWTELYRKLVNSGQI